MVVNDQFVLCKAALIFAVTRWILSFALNLLTNSTTLFSDSFPNRKPSCGAPSTSLDMVKKILHLTTLGEIEHRLPEGHDLSCAVCLTTLKKESQVWELSNCTHMFHRNCLEQWIGHDNRLSCPLCRASLLPVSGLPLASQPEQPNWAVEQILYLFGDDSSLDS